MLSFIGNAITGFTHRHIPAPFLFCRYSTLVDAYVPNIAACLRDPNPIIRQQTLSLLTRLLSVRSIQRLFVAAQTKT